METHEIINIFERFMRSEYSNVEEFLQFYGYIIEPEHLHLIREYQHRKNELRDALESSAARAYVHNETYGKNKLQKLKNVVQKKLMEKVYSSNNTSELLQLNRFLDEVEKKEELSSDEGEKGKLTTTWI